MPISFGASLAAMIAAGIVAQQPATNRTDSTTDAFTLTPPSTTQKTNAQNAATRNLSPTTQQDQAAADPLEPGQLGKVTVNSDLDLARDQIAPSLGAVTYNIGPREIQSIPGGENASFQQVLIRAPGVVQDSFGQEHVRGEHANLTYRVNGVFLPEPLNGFGQELDTRLIQSVTLIDGALPAQFGFHTAGIVDVTTKTGSTLNHNELSLYGGSYDTIEPSIQFGGTDGKLDYFFVGSYNHNSLGIENPTPSHSPIHDYTDQERFFGYLSYRLDDTSRISLFANASNSQFSIPNTEGLTPAFTLAGSGPRDSAGLNESQNEQEYYTVVSYQKTEEDYSFQLSAFSRYGQLAFDPDRNGDLIFQGVSSAVYNNFTTNGLQLDSSYRLRSDHTLRAGFQVDYTYANLNSNTGVFPVDADGNATSTTPTFFSDHTDNQATESGVYLQDEWKINPSLTLNYGARYDRFDASFDTEQQLSPRVNLVYKIDEQTTAHVGYARYFVPPPTQNTELGSIQQFDGTTNGPGNFGTDPSKVERSNYYDIGISRQITKPWLVSIDGFYKDARNLVDLGQFGEAVILSPFNYRRAKVYGAELATTYKVGGLSLFGNGAWVETRAHDIDSQQFQIDNDELAFIVDHDIKLDHQAEFAGSAGASYAWKNDMVYADFLFATGLRTGFANTGQVQAHYPVNVGYQHIFHLDDDRHAVRFRVDVVNVFDQKYEIRDGGGIGVGAAQFGQRLSAYAGISYEF